VGHVWFGAMGGQSKAWPAVTGPWTDMGVDAACGTPVRTRFFSRRQEGRAMRKAHHPFHGKRRYGAHAEPWLDSTLFVTLPAGNRGTQNAADAAIA
jgi:hypothetical protein